MVQKQEEGSKTGGKVLKYLSICRIVRGTHLGASTGHSRLWATLGRYLGTSVPSLRYYTGHRQNYRTMVGTFDQIDLAGRSVTASCKLHAHPII